MNEVQKEQLIDEYDEATLKLFMEKYEEFEGTLLWNEYQTALRANELAPMPTELDVRCKDIIRIHLLSGNSS